MRTVRLCFVLLLVLGCDDKDESPGHKFLNEVMVIMQDHSINRLTINWIDFRTKVFKAAGDASTDEDVNRGLKTALVELGDHHSFITRGTTGTFINGTNNTDCVSNYTGAPDLRGNNIGYIRIAGYSGNDNAFAINIQKKIQEQDNADLTGWIVDLRGNTGGNMWPMLAGIGPILGEGISGYFIDPLGKEDWYGYNSGNSQDNGTTINVVPFPYKLINQSPKVAVLTDAGTASSGEAITIAFINRPNTRSFGSATCGLSTANSGYPLSDGGRMNLTVAVMADRDKNKKGGPLPPDVLVKGDQEVIDAAIEWLSASQ